MTWDQLFTEQKARILAGNDAAEHNYQLRRYKTRLIESEQNLARTQALLKKSINVLYSIDPGSSFFDTSYQISIGDAACQIMQRGGTWDEIKGIGSKFPLPPRAPDAPPPPVPAGSANSSVDSGELAQARAEIADLRGRLARAHTDLVDYLVQRTAFRAELARVEPSNPLVTNGELRKSLCLAGHQAFARYGGDWSAVVEVGENYLAHARREAAQGKGLLVQG